MSQQQKKSKKVVISQTSIFAEKGNPVYAGAKIKHWNNHRGPNVFSFLRQKK